MILAGIDEAGYGPLLGPLVVGCCAFDIGPCALGDDALAQLPCLWKRLRRLVGKSRDRAGRKIHVNDSKLVYSPSGGVGQLERSVLAIAAAWQECDADLTGFLSRTAGHVVPELNACRWYRPAADERFPLEHDGMSIRLLANALREEMKREQAVCVEMSARVVLEGSFNRLIAGTRNKGAALFSTSAIHIDRLLRLHGRDGLCIVCDRQGGRERYGSLLRLMFEDWSLVVVGERPDCSEYRLHRDAATVAIVFREKAEAQCLPVAVASMLSKYIRETLMRRFNAFWLGHVPNLAPTAGYYEDGTRFLRDIEPKRRELGIADREFVRSR
jgi:hypothetical protein